MLISFGMSELKSDQSLHSLNSLMRSLNVGFLDIKDEVRNGVCLDWKVRERSRGAWGNGENRHNNYWYKSSIKIKKNGSFLVDEILA